MRVKNNQGKIIEVTEKAYNYLYKNRGFKIINDLNTPNNDLKETSDIIVNEEVKTPSEYEILSEKTNRELKDILQAHNIKYNDRANKNDLISLIVENMEG